MPSGRRARCCARRDGHARVCRYPRRTGRDGAGTGAGDIIGLCLAQRPDDDRGPAAGGDRGRGARPRLGGQGDEGGGAGQHQGRALSHPGVAARRRKRRDHRHRAEARHCRAGQQRRDAGGRDHRPGGVFCRLCRARSRSAGQPCRPNRLHRPSHDARAGWQQLWHQWRGAACRPGAGAGQGCRRGADPQPGHRLSPQPAYRIDEHAGGGDADRISGVGVARCRIAGAAAGSGAGERQAGLDAGVRRQWPIGECVGRNSGRRRAGRGDRHRRAYRQLGYRAGRHRRRCRHGDHAGGGEGDKGCRVAAAPDDPRGVLWLGRNRHLWRPSLWRGACERKHRAGGGK